MELLTRRRAFPFLLLLAETGLLRRLKKRPAVHTLLLPVFAMALAGYSIAIFLMHFLCSAIVSPDYFRLPANRSNEDLIPHLRPWLIVSDEWSVAQWLCGAVPPDRRISWADWLTPLGATTPAWHGDVQTVSPAPALQPMKLEESAGMA